MLFNNIHQKNKLGKYGLRYMINDKPQYRIEKFVPCDLELYPRWENNMAKIILSTGFNCGGPNDNKSLVGIWGRDDFGLEKFYTHFDDALNEYNKIDYIGSSFPEGFKNA